MNSLAYRFVRGLSNVWYSLRRRAGYKRPSLPDMPAYLPQPMTVIGSFAYRNMPLLIRHIVSPRNADKGYYLVGFPAGSIKSQNS